MFKGLQLGHPINMKNIEIYIFYTFFSATLTQENNCSLMYNGEGSPGYYAVALQVEDFTSDSSRVAMSSVPVQFLVEVVNFPNPPTGVTPPMFVGSTPSSGDCISVAIGSTYATEITAKSGGEKTT